VPLDGRLLVTHQDALLVGGKVRAAAGYADHVVVLDPRRCETCGARLCVEVCSGQALTPGSSGSPAFDREKCVHCGACQWSCTEPHPSLPGRTNLELRAGIGGLHSSEN
jgi:electron-transferring-flavoprotein dehydrogenase